MTKPAKSPSELEEHLGYWLRLTSNEVSGAFARAIAIEDVSPAEWVVLRLLHREEKRTSGDLATLTGMTRGAVSKILDKLGAKSLVTRATNPSDSRVQWISLTRKGDALVPTLAAIADRNDARFFDCLKKKEKAALRHVLGKLAAAHGMREIPVD